MVIIRNCEVKDLDEIRKFINRCKPLGLHTAFTYWVLLYYANNSCFVMEDNSKIIGYISGLKSTSLPDIFYLWQIGISPEYRGKGYSFKLIDKIVNAAKILACDKLHVSIAPDNMASYHAFTSYAKKKGITLNKIDEIKFYDSLSDKKETESVYELIINTSS